VLDALVTYGLASAALSLSGLAERGIARLDTKTGEYCCSVHSAKIQQDHKEVSPKVVQSIVYGKACPFPKLNCRLMKEAACGASVANIASLFDSLKDKGALEEKEGQWTVPL
jgi:hypothetical protein